MTKFTGKLGLYKHRQKYSTKERFVSVSKGCVQLSPDALAAMGLKIGDRYVVGKGVEDRTLVVKRSNSPKSQELQEPESIRFQATHVLEFLGNNARISAQDLPLTDIIFELTEDQLVGSLPESVKTSSLQQRKDRVAANDWRVVVAGYTGASAAIALEAHRYGMNAVPVSLPHVLWLLREEGHRIGQINGRLWQLDDSTATLGDLIQLARKYEEGLVLVAA